MIALHLNDLVEVDPKLLAKQIEEAGGDVTLTLTVRAQYEADSKWALAEGWLRTWYIAESIARHASKASCDFEQGDDGAGEFELELSGVDANALSKKLVEFAPVFDPNELEPGALMYDEAAEWLEKRGGQPAKFPDLEEAYRDDLAVAKEHTALYGDDDDDDS